MQRSGSTEGTERLSRVALLGVTGGIAAYKSCQLVRDLQSRGFDVHVVMTESAKQFVGPITFQALTGNQVHSGLWDASASATSHISLAQRADVIVVAPATANVIAKLAQGIGDDLLSTLVIASSCPLVVAPAMNPNMFDDQSVRDNLAALRCRGTVIVEPASGIVACGDEGAGKLADTSVIAQEADLACAASTALAGIRVVITAGPTREPIDSVRYLSNRSTGLMGYSLARSFLRVGAEVVLISGPTALPAPRGARMVPVETAREMLEAVIAYAPSAGLYVGTAAVSDFSVAQPQEGKIKRENQGPPQLSLVMNQDIVATLAQMRAEGHTDPGLRIVAFAAEVCDSATELAMLAQQKMDRKHVDAIVANRVGIPGTGFESDANEVLYVSEGASIHFPPAPKPELARLLTDHIVTQFFADTM